DCLDGVAGTDARSCGQRSAAGRQVVAGTVVVVDGANRRQRDPVTQGRHAVDQDVAAGRGGGRHVAASAASVHRGEGEVPARGVKGNCAIGGGGQGDDQAACRIVDVDGARAADGGRGQGRDGRVEIDARGRGCGQRAGDDVARSAIA